MNIVDKAMQYAMDAHRGQYRKNIKIPYFTHCVEVMKRVSLYTQDEDILCIAVDHDVIEDSEIFDFLAEFQGYYDKIIENLEIPNGYAIAKALLCPIQEYDDFFIEVRVQFSRLETDEEVLQRLFNRIRRDIRKYQKSLKTKESAEDKERKLYENLKKKYETNK